MNILPWELLPLISLDRCLEESCWLLVNAGEGLLGTDGTLNDKSLLSLEPPTWCPSECSKGPLGILGLSKSISGLGRSQSILCLEIQNNSSNSNIYQGVNIKKYRTNSNKLKEFHTSTALLISYLIFFQICEKWI